MGWSKAIWMGCEDMGLDSAVSDKQELHYAHSDEVSNAAGVQKENKNRAPDARHVPAQNAAAPAIRDRQGLREHQRGDVANYIAASNFTAISSTSRRRSCGSRRW
jgi:hypothetical protein